MFQPNVLEIIEPLEKATDYNGREYLILLKTYEVVLEYVMHTNKWTKKKEYLSELRLFLKLYILGTMWTDYQQFRNMFVKTTKKIDLIIEEQDIIDS